MFAYLCLEQPFWNSIVGWFRGGRTPPYHINFEMRFGNPRQNNFSFDMCLTLRRWVSRLVPFLLLYRLFPSPINNWDFKPCKNIILDRSWKQMIPPNKWGINLETKFLKDKPMSRQEFSYLDIPNSESKSMFLSMCGLPSLMLSWQPSKPRFQAFGYKAHSVWWSWRALYQMLVYEVSYLIWWNSQYGAHDN